MYSPCHIAERDVFVCVYIRFLRVFATTVGWSPYFFSLFFSNVHRSLCMYICVRQCIRTSTQAKTEKQKPESKKVARKCKRNERRSKPKKNVFLSRFSINFVSSISVFRFYFCSGFFFPYFSLSFSFALFYLAQCLP